MMPELTDDVLARLKRFTGDVTLLSDEDVLEILEALPSLIAAAEREKESADLVARLHIARSADAKRIAELEAALIQIRDKADAYAHQVHWCREVAREALKGGAK